MFTSRIFATAAFVLALGGQAQDVPMTLPIEDLIAKQDLAVINSQGATIRNALEKAAEPYQKSVVAIVAGNRMLAAGIIVAPGKVLSKYSELLRSNLPLAIMDTEGKVYDMRVWAHSRENDITLLDVPGLEHAPVDLNKTVRADEGSIVMLYSPEGLVTDFGVISVEPRSLRESDQAYIGIGIDPRWHGRGARVETIEFHSPAHQAGLMPGDLIEKVNNKAIDGLFSLRTVLNEVNPGDSVPISLQRNGKTLSATIMAGSRPTLQTFPAKRLEYMNVLGGHRLSRHRHNFPYVYQSDLTLLPERAGSPVIDLEGRLVGMALSRAGRMETYILPAEVIQELTRKALASPDSEEIPVAEAVEE